MAKQNNAKRVNFLLMYRVFDRGARKLYIKVCPVVDGVPEVDKSSLFKAPKYTPSPSWTCTALGTIAPDGTIDSLNTGDIRPVTQWFANSTDYRLKDQLARDEHRLYAAANKESNLEVIDKTLEPIKRLYNSTNAAGKSALIALVINRLTK
ncbi:hypothetical protein VPEG_00026 [Vibrio phage SIO-2]|uniref:hypothetical protein n=1 Tax=Vibrio phage SIO-2 TaxID=700512 RepID=UPI0002357C40|nr:hypothetical protein VPEG_00026 [Vibrio phage SIO-2]AET42177.1 hypothetical protein VPEG_00026 [Vibrio phage SIO-2]